MSYGATKSQRRQHHVHTIDSLQPIPLLLILCDLCSTCRQLVCPACHHVEPLNRGNINTMCALEAVRCSACGKDDLRFKIMLYDDDQVGEGSNFEPHLMNCNDLG